MEGFYKEGVWGKTLLAKEKSYFRLGPLPLEERARISFGRWDYLIFLWGMERAQETDSIIFSEEEISE